MICKAVLVLTLVGVILEVNWGIFGFSLVFLWEFFFLYFRPKVLVSTAVWVWEKMCAPLQNAPK